jgi:FecR protein
MSDYLWDKSGEPDPEIERLEKLLTPLGHRGEPGRGQVLALPSRRIWNRAWVPVAIAASMLIVVCGSWLNANRNRAAWQVSSLQGAASVSRLARGQSLKTDAGSRAKLELDAVGEVEVEPNSQLSVVTLGRDEQRLDLKRGTIHATIWAPPGQFFVNTPSAVTVDLGCAYTLEVDSSGAGTVKVTAGWVAFESNGHESFIPATARCVTRPGKGPGIPYYEDSEQALQGAVDRFDSSADAGAIPSILVLARPRDAITLWHLLRRVPTGERGAVYDRLAQLITIPARVTRAGVVSGDASMTDALWDSLDLGDTSWWRMWKSRLR